MYHIKERVTSSIEIKKSRFYGILLPLDNEKGIKEVINNLKKEYPAATHYCYGAIISGNYRSNDDGEPASTAGKPILEALKNNDLDNVLCVVVRYFGGTLLGTNGLIKAYGQATTEAIQAATFTLPTTVYLYDLQIDYDYTNRIEQLLKQQAFNVTRDFNEYACYHYQCKKDLSEEIAKITSGKYQPVYIGCSIIETPVSKN